MNKIIKPRCGECTHLKENAHTLWCDIPNGNRKASKDVGGCDNFENKSMVWQDYKIEGDSIILTKQEIQEAKNHYCKVADKFKPKKKDTTLDPRYMLYIGKADVLIDILKMFEPLEG